MRLLPYNIFVIKTKDGLDKINAKLAGVTTIGSQSLYPKAVLTPFIGHINDNGFKISLSGYDPIDAVYKRNSFSPQIIGKYKTYDEYTEIVITQRVVLPIILVASIWMIGVLFALLLCAMLVLQGAGFDFVYLIPLIMLVIMLEVIGVGFWHDADNSKEILSGVLMH
jgi:hypothetical protein